MKADCIVDGIKPTVSVDSIGLLALMGWMNAEYCGLEWNGKADLQYFLVQCVSKFCKSLVIDSRLYAKMKI